jgi:hypothetical protein
MAVLGQALVPSREKASEPSFRQKRKETSRNSLSVVRPLEPVLAGERVDPLRSPGSVRVRLGLGFLTLFPIDPMQDRSKDLFPSLHSPRQ